MTHRTIITYSPYIVSFLMFLAVSTPFVVEAQAEFLGNGLKSVLYFIVVNFLGWLIWAGGYLLNIAVNDYVIGFGQSFTTSGVGVAVDQLWVVVRDFFNIMFIFGLVYIGFKMILDSGDSATRKTLIYLVMAALLVNFSLFITKFVVDFTNILAREVALAGFPVAGAAAQVNIADTFFALMGIPGTLDAPPDVMQETSNTFAYIFGSALIYIIAAFVFFTGAIMLIIRFVALSIYMVLSPFMFIGWVFPGFQSMTRKYWSGFLGRAFYAPVYIILLFFAGNILQQLFGPGGSMQGGGALNPTGSPNAPTFAGIIAPFILSSAFLIAAVQVAGKLSADGASTVMKVGGNLSRKAQRGAVGVGRFGVRNTAGYVTRGVGAGAEKDRVRLNRGLSTLAQKGAIGRATARTLDRTLGAGLDKAAGATIAGAETAKQERDRINKQNAKLNTARSEFDRSNETGKDLAKITELKDKKKKLKAAGKKLSKDDKDALAAARGRLGGNVAKMSNDEVLLLDKKTLQNKEFAQNMTEAHIKAVKESGIYTNQEGKKIAQANIDGTQDRFAEVLGSTDATVEDLTVTLDQLAQTMERMSTDKLLDLGGDKNDDKKTQWLLNERVAANLSEKQLEELQNSGRFSAEQMTDIRAARERGLVTIATGRTMSGPGTENQNIINDSNTANRDATLKRRREKLFQGSAKAAGQLPAAVYKEIDPMLITPAALAERDRNGLDATTVDGAGKTEVDYIQENIQNLSGGTTEEQQRYEKWKDWSKSTAGVQSRFNFV